MYVPVAWLGHDLPTLVKDRVILILSRGFNFYETSQRSFSKINLAKISDFTVFPLKMQVKDTHVSPRS